MDEGRMKRCFGFQYLASLVLILLVLAREPNRLASSQLDLEDQQPVGTLFVSCGDTAPYRSQEVRSPTLASPDGLYKAYVVVKASAQENSCSNYSRLFVKGPGDKSYRVIRELKPEPTLYGNGLRMVDWSPQGHSLSLMVLIFQFGSDVGWTEPWVYDADLDRFYYPPLNKLFAEVFRQDCAIRLADILGYSPDGQLILKVGDDWTVDEVIDNNGPRCIGAEDQVWRLDFKNNKVLRLSSLERPQRYGRIGTER